MGHSGVTRGGERHKPCTHLEALVPLLPQVAPAALLALGEGGRELVARRGVEVARDTTEGGGTLPQSPRSGHSCGCM